MVAVATRTQGFTTLPGLIPAFTFHALTNLAGLQLLRMGRVPVEQVSAEAA